MAIPAKRSSAAESLATISNVVLSAFIILALYFGRDLLVPLALSALLTFMLAPLVTLLQRWLGRIGAVLLVVVMMFAVTAWCRLGPDPPGHRSRRATAQLQGEHPGQTAFDPSMPSMALSQKSRKPWKT
jgi:hypothetical protein